MIAPGDLLAELAARGVREVTGVPCSHLTPLINRVASDPAVGYLRATHEGEALALAAGAWLAGTTCCVIAQNSGLGNMVNPLVSLIHPARIPVPLVVTWRGEPGRPDEPQHELQGAITGDLLDLVELTHSVVPAARDGLAPCLDAGWRAMSGRGLPHAFVLRAGVLAAEPLTEPPPADPFRPPVEDLGQPGAPTPTRSEALGRLLEVLPAEAGVVATTGKTGRELFTLADRPPHFYLVGAMGSASAVGLGASRHTRRPLVVLDGDGAALMRLGSLATVAAYGGPGLVHVLLDNQVHDSTGGQLSLAAQVDLPAVAAACGYRRVVRAHDLGGLAAAVTDGVQGTGPSFVYLRIAAGSLSDLGRPDLHPADVARRFRDFLTDDAFPTDEG